MFKVQQEISDHRMADLLCAALEGGIGHWACLIKTELGEEDVKPWGDDYTPKYIQAPFCTGGSLTFCDVEDEDTVWTLTRDGMQEGLDTMTEKYPNRTADFLAENDDAETGDVFVQCALLGDIDYG